MKCHWLPRELPDVDKPVNVGLGISLIRSLKFCQSGKAIFFLCHHSPFPSGGATSRQWVMVNVCLPSASTNQLPFRKCTETQYPRFCQPRTERESLGGSLAGVHS
jgi:hypothetical protein